MYLSLIFPSYNEISNIKKGVVDSIFASIEKQKLDCEVIFADDGSTDGTIIELEKVAGLQKNVRVLRLPHRGKGPTVLSALESAKGEYRLFSDFDQATPLSELDKLLPHAQKGADIVIGSREIVGSSRKNEPLHRHLMGKGFNFFVNLIALNGIHDTQCGFKLFSKKACDQLLPKVWVYSAKGSLSGAFTGAFDVELLYLARKAKMRIDEVPIVWTYAKTDRVDPIKDSLRMLIDISRIRLADLLGRYA